MSNVYITTAIPYVNGTPHIGHAIDYLLSDTYARYRRALGDTVRFQAGTDEHGNKVHSKAISSGLEVQEYVDINSQKFQDFIHQLGVEYTDFIRTTDKDHIRRCQAIWLKIKDHIYSATYEGWYCEGCEGFISDKEYNANQGSCPEHQKPYQKLSETNYYLRIKDFKDQIHTAIFSDQMLILPDYRKKELLKLLADTPDVSISRPRKNLSWGVPVPDDDTQVMYVWIDALANYITVLGYPDQDISDFWPATVQFIGKDILRFHAIIWPALLLALKLPLPKVLCTHGFVLADGQKMGKSLGNAIDPIEVLNRHGLDAFRYFFLRHIDTFADSNFTWEKFNDAYNNELANDLGNLVQRLTTLAQQNQFTYQSSQPQFDSEYRSLMDNFQFSKAFDYVWEKVQKLNKTIDEVKPWTLAKAGDQQALSRALQELITELLEINHMLAPFLPTASTAIQDIFSATPITPPITPLFPKQ